jgi:hypothetical protein
MQDSWSAEHDTYVFKSQNGTKVLHLLHQILHTCHYSGFHLEAQFQNYLHDVHKKECMYITKELLQATDSTQPETSCFHRT